MVNFLSGVSAVDESLTNLVRGNTTSHEVDPGTEVIGTPKKRSTAKRASESINATPSPEQKIKSLNKKKDTREAAYALDRKSLPGVGADKDGAKRSLARPRTTARRTPAGKSVQDEECVLSPPRTARVTGKGKHNERTHTGEGVPEQSEQCATSSVTTHDGPASRTRSLRKIHGQTEEDDMSALETTPVDARPKKQR